MLFLFPGMPFPPLPDDFLLTLQNLAPPVLFPEPPAAVGGQGPLLGAPQQFTFLPGLTALHPTNLLPRLFPT